MVDDRFPAWRTTLLEILVGRINEIRVTGRLACAKPPRRRLIFTPMEMSFFAV